MTRYKKPHITALLVDILAPDDDTRHVDRNGSPACGATPEGAWLVEHPRSATCEACVLLGAMRVDVIDRRTQGRN